MRESPTFDDGKRSVEDVKPFQFRPQGIQHAAGWNQTAGRKEPGDEQCSNREPREEDRLDTAVTQPVHHVATRHQRRSKEHDGRKSSQPRRSMARCHQRSVQRSRIPSGRQMAACRRALTRSEMHAIPVGGRRPGRT